MRAGSASAARSSAPRFEEGAELYVLEGARTRAELEDGNAFKMHRERRCFAATVLALLHAHATLSRLRPAGVEEDNDGDGSLFTSECGSGVGSSDHPPPSQ